MSKLSALVLGVMLAIGPNGSVLCDAWCATDERAQECHETLASVVAANCCDSPATSLTAVAGRESRQETVAPGLDAGGSHRLVQEPVPSAGLIRRDQPRASLPNSLVTVLRI